LLKACTDNSNPIFVGRFRESAGRKKAKQARAASEQLLPLRNDTKGHGFLEEEPQYQTRYDRHVSAIQLLMEFVRPLASYRLIKVGEGLKRRHGVSVFPAKVLMGSHPLFPVEQHQTDLAVDTDCLLYDPETKTYLTLFPWLLMDHCKECFRETVFLYDRLDEAGAGVREYPTNHVQVRSVDLPPDLLALIQ
jgi:hypothetical protein